MIAAVYLGDTLYATSTFCRLRMVTVTDGPTVHERPVDARSR